MKKVASKIELGHKQLPNKVIIITGNRNTVVKLSDIRETLFLKALQKTHTLYLIMQVKSWH